MKYVFLFGAGASKYSGGINKMPPLGGELFEELKSNFPKTWGNLSLDLIKDFENKKVGFEKPMTKLFNETDTSQLMKDMALYFSQFNIINKKNLYSKLVSEILNMKLTNNVLLSTINYEGLIEKAIEFCEGRLSYCFEGIEKKKINLVKLHGSCNFLSKYAKVSGGGQIIGLTIGGGGIEAIPFEMVNGYHKGDNQLNPIMAIYAQNKPFQFLPLEIEFITRLWEKSVFLAEKVFIVGVKPNLEDFHIWGPLLKTRAKLYFVFSLEDFNYLRKKTGINEGYLGDTFESTFTKLINELN